MKVMSLVTLEENIGLDESSLRFMLNSRIKERELKVRVPVFNRRGSIERFNDTVNIPTCLGTLLTDLKRGNQYAVYASSYGGMFTEDGSQTQYHNFELVKLSPNFEPRTVSRGDYSYRLNVPLDFCLAKLTISHSTDWDGSGETDVIRGENGKTTLVGENDAFIQSIIDYMKS